MENGLSIIAAIGRNYELGKNNDLIWHLPNDLKFFKEKTMGHTIIMGRKTFESLPKMLPNRKHIVISSSDNFPSEVEVLHSEFDFIMNHMYLDDHYFVIGGGQIYKMFIPYVEDIYLTEIDATCADADTFFPEFSGAFPIREVLDENEENGIKYNHVLYRRK